MAAPGLTDRQRDVLRAVVESHLQTGRPVGSKALVERGGLAWAPSTIRGELAALEREGYLTHPHTSAGRQPTDAGYRLYAQSLLGHAEPQPSRGAPAPLSRVRQEVDEAIEQTLSALARANDLAAVATAPAPETDQIHRVEVLRLHARQVLVVVITSTGEVSKRSFHFTGEVDPGLVAWAGSYLHERLAGLGLGSRLLAGRLADRQLGEAEQAFVAALAPAFRDLGGAGGHELYVDGTARLVSDERVPELPGLAELLRALEGRASLLAALRSALDHSSVFLWIGSDSPAPELRSASVVGANYGLGWRNLGSVGVIGPVRMDYSTAIATVRSAATELSRYFADVYES